MPKKTQEEKLFTSLAGEFAVASELNRRHVYASITFGNSKSADIFAINPHSRKLAVIEVKSTPEKRWLVGDRATIRANCSKDSFWVLAHITKPKERIRYFILSSEELHYFAVAEGAFYNISYEERHGKPYTKNGAPGVSMKDILEHEDKWEKISDFLEIPIKT